MGSRGAWGTLEEGEEGGSGECVCVCVDGRGGGCPGGTGGGGDGSVRFHAYQFNSIPSAFVVVLLLFVCFSLPDCN